MKRQWIQGRQKVRLGRRRRRRQRICAWILEVGVVLYTCY
jgi:hypothetical protein